ncbi:hypothetical protein TVAG_302190 [Trichomonas vaginalis G3]|uniref:Bromo domain-containing protein n=1 Tax=Trichomonas vaginalis (strain ATCC PRA-98 / G3) TaxID=412133 RepID=A2EGP4_TRIV3|nr:hypothetical protein TVAGG3_0173150 [Trichomonas vaginalis G3]EAY08132.1 hypothetical protein TVAG_302190 [Trichomonas vaginalis G3]KAI5548737.1 hypothetical protein TVAGG3_0173150 [Trichomonas vaginalis G3]|eukprot:XP_001320355.1 hypothetical protein [Trichomonas vaginalis G3]
MNTDQVPWRQPAFSIACNFMHYLVDNPLSNIYSRKGINPVENILNKLEKSSYSLVCEWKQALYKIFNDTSSFDEEEKQINNFLKSKFDKKYEYIMKLENANFRDIMEDVDKKVKLITEHSTKETFTFQKLSEM